MIAYSPMASGLLTGEMTRERIAALPADDWRKEKNMHYQEPLLTRQPEARGTAEDDRRAARQVPGRSGDRVGAAASGRHRRRSSVPEDRGS